MRGTGRGALFGGKGMEGENVELAGIIMSPGRYQERVATSEQAALVPDDARG